MVLDTNTRVVALVGGVGGAKLVYGLSTILQPDQLTVIGNVADDFELYGLHISPDLDTVMYTMAGLANPTTGWGIEGDTWHVLEMLQCYGEDAWFRLGDRDLGTHILRTQWLRQGHTLTVVTQRLISSLGVKSRLLPVTDDPLVTMIDTVEHGTLAFQDYFVRHRWQPTVKHVWFKHADQAHMTESVKTALHDADVILVCPSNPVLSIAPLLAVPGMREMIEKRRAVCVGVSPFVGGNAVKGPAAKLMQELGMAITPRGLIDFYAGGLDGLVIDVSDRDQPLHADVPVLVTRTLMQTSEDKVRLARELFKWVGSITT
ncbi:MAG: 2-phospho-L-lactate transferase [Anaerolineae bacterium]|nr:2-phospho-L-lactate transferase [Anaerolineae bacterium]